MLLIKHKHQKGKTNLLNIVHNKINEKFKDNFKVNNKYLVSIARNN